MRKYSIILYFTAVSIVLFNSGCKKITGFSKGNLSFSADTIVFDTVFTTIGSTTRQFKIYNTENKTVTIEEIELMGGENSPFRMNLDGASGKKFSQIQLEGKDSLFAFVEVTLDINASVNPMVIQDSIRFRTNGVDQYVQLAVWGQDMYYHYSHLGAGPNVLDLNEGTWPNDKPHLIYGAAFVDEDKTLNIQAGTDIYLHKNALLYVYKGTLNINGALNNEVTVQGDRLEADYDDVSGQYYGIYFDSARPSTINYAIIKNGTTGIHLFDHHASNLSTDYTLTVTNTKVTNNANNGILIYSGARVKADNCVISKNGAFGLLVLLSGDFNFNHCDLVGYNSDSQNQAVGITNHFDIDGVTNIGSIHEGVLTNCAIYGQLASEIGFDTIGNTAGVTLDFKIQNCLIKKETIGTDPFYIAGNIWNIDPQFVDVSLNNFKIYSTSPMTGTANNILFPTMSGLNIEGVTSSNIGAY